MQLGGAAVPCMAALPAPLRAVNGSGWPAHPVRWSVFKIPVGRGRFSGVALKLFYLNQAFIQSADAFGIPVATVMSRLSSS